MTYERAFMEGSLDAFDFLLAERLGMTVGELRDRMSNDEYLQWRAYIKWRNAMQELELKSAQAGGARL